MTWSDVAVAGAFVLGTIAGAAGAIRLTRIIFDHLRNREPPRE